MLILQNITLDTTYKHCTDQPIMGNKRESSPAGSVPPTASHWSKFAPWSYSPALPYDAIQPFGRPDTGSTVLGWSGERGQSSCEFSWVGCRHQSCWGSNTVTMMEAVSKPGPSPNSVGDLAMVATEALRRGAEGCTQASLGGVQARSLSNYIF